MIRHGLPLAGVQDIHSKIHLLQWVTAGIAALYHSCGKPDRNQTWELKKRDFAGRHKCVQFI